MEVDILVVCARLCMYSDLFICGIHSWAGALICHWNKSWKNSASLVIGGARINPTIAEVWFQVQIPQ